jgi:hypothetical protein
MKNNGLVGGGIFCGCGAAPMVQHCRLNPGHEAARLPFTGISSLLEVLATNLSMLTTTTPAPRRKRPDATIRH